MAYWKNRPRNFQSISVVFLSYLVKARCGRRSQKPKYDHQVAFYRSLSGVKQDKKRHVGRFYISNISSLFFVRSGAVVYDGGALGNPALLGAWWSKHTHDYGTYINNFAITADSSGPVMLLSNTALRYWPYSLRCLAIE